MPGMAAADAAQTGAHIRQPCLNAGLLGRRIALLYLLFQLLWYVQGIPPPCRESHPVCVSISSGGRNAASGARRFRAPPRGAWARRAAGPVRCWASPERRAPRETAGVSQAPGAEGRFGAPARFGPLVQPDRFHFLLAGLWPLLLGYGKGVVILRLGFLVYQGRIQTGIDAFSESGSKHEAQLAHRALRLVKPGKDVPGAGAFGRAGLHAAVMAHRHDAPQGQHLHRQGLLPVQPAREEQGRFAGAGLYFIRRSKA